jgi:hypothetical protein
MEIKETIRCCRSDLTRRLEAALVTSDKKLTALAGNHGLETI